MNDQNINAELIREQQNFWLAHELKENVEITSVKDSGRFLKISYKSDQVPGLCGYIFNGTFDDFMKKVNFLINSKFAR